MADGNPTPSESPRTGAGGRTVPENAFVLIAGILFGTIPIFATLLSRYGVAAIAQSWWRLALLLPFLLSVLFVRWKSKSWTQARGAWLNISLYGLLIAVTFTTFIGALALGTSVSVTIFAFYTQPAICVVLGRVWLGEIIDLRKAAAVLISVTGLIVVVTLTLPAGGPPEGYALALSSGVAFSIYILATRSGETRSHVDPLPLLTLTLLFGLLWLSIGMALLQALNVTSLLSAGYLLIQPSSLVLLLGFSVIATLLPYLALTLGLKSVEASTASVLLLVEPPTAILLAVLFLGQVPPIGEIVGGVLILSGVFLIATDANRAHRAE